MHRLAQRLVTCLGLLLLLGTGVPGAAAQSASSPPEIVRTLSSALDRVQARLDAGDAAGARAAYDAFESVWFNVEDTVRGLAGGSYRSIEDAMRSLRDAVYQGTAEPARARNALADLRAQVNAFGAQVGVAPAAASSFTGGALAASASSSPAASAAPSAGGAAPAPAVASASGPSTEECARYSGRAALPYFNYALALASGSTLPGIPPAQAMTPLYSYGPGPVPGSVAAGPYRPIYPYFSRFGPGGVAGGVGVGGGNPVLTSQALNAAFLQGGQLNDFRNGALGPLGTGDILGLAGQQATEVGNRIALGDLQQSLLGNQLGTSELRSTWIGTYLSISEQARDIALSLCGRIPG